MPEATTRVHEPSATFVLYPDAQRPYRWRLVAGNGRIIADSGEGYESAGAARRAIDRVRHAVHDADIEERCTTRARRPTDPSKTRSRPWIRCGEADGPPSVHYLRSIHAEGAT